MAGKGGKKVTIMDAKRFLMKAEDIFQDQREKFDELVKVMMDFKAHRLGALGVMMKAEKIFKGHEDLILEFNNFLPKGYVISLPLENEQPSQKAPIQYDDAINYMDKIKARIQNNDVYISFLNILKRYRDKDITIVEVEREVVKLLMKDYPDLVREFTKFLPYCN